MRAYLGIDGGGTRTRSLLVSEVGEILGRAVVGPSNVQQVGMLTLHETLQLLLDRTFLNLPKEIEYISSCFGLAGAASAENKEEIRDRFIASLQAVEPNIVIQKSLMAPIVGAVVVACKKSNDGLPPELEKALTAELTN